LRKYLTALPRLLWGRKRGLAFTANARRFIARHKAGAFCRRMAWRFRPTFHDGGTRPGFLWARQSSRPSFGAVSPEVAVFRPKAAGEGGPAWSGSPLAAPAGSPSSQARCCPHSPKSVSSVKSAVNSRLSFEFSRALLWQKSPPSFPCIWRILRFKNQVFFAPRRLRVSALNPLFLTQRRQGAKTQREKIHSPLTTR